MIANCLDKEFSTITLARAPILRHRPFVPETNPLCHNNNPQPPPLDYTTPLEI